MEKPFKKDQIEFWGGISGGQCCVNAQYNRGNQFNLLGLASTSLVCKVCEDLVLIRGSR